MQEIATELKKAITHFDHMKDENIDKTDIFTQLRCSAKKISEIAIDNFSEKGLSLALKISESIAQFTNYMDDFIIREEQR